MNYIPYLVFLISLSGINLILLFLIHFLDFINTQSKQKIIIFRIGLVIMMLAPFIFIILRFFSWHMLFITFSDHLLFGQDSSHSAPVEFIKTKIHWSFYIFCAYIVGFSIMIFRILFSYLVTRKKLVKSSLSFIDDQLVFLNDNIQSPISFGFPSAKIYFPSNAKSKWTERVIKISLAHEKNHLKQNDSLWKLLSLIVQAILWFVPWSNALHRKFELEMEIFCDEKTRDEIKINAKEYGELLLTMLSVQSNHLMLVNLSDSNLKRRILAMQTNKKIQRPILTSIFSITLLLIGSTAIAMTSGITDKKTTFDISTKIVIDGQLISSPRIIAHSNQVAAISLANKDESESLRMKVIAKDTSTLAMKDAIEMNFDVQYKNGKEKIHTKPHIILAPHQEGKIKISSDAGHTYEMDVLVERK